ncbi:hypothetical protein [Dactylosporangium matsuzakiense]|uniref:Uncharacterized protein n=1 Tax=Dactylosporangium matsuzakiense TaxID=53360 RepID=A0A9W6NT82_9ACTN|nr:hypothetical protein [Dactylosporangium matsuzakiense]GLL08278.1 hypothetical protein GCM10017581_100390 [Dactylosporangium matsuzakiense]
MSATPATTATAAPAAGGAPPGSAGETAYLSEVLAEVYCGTAPAW